jgi:hypothetical protein
MEVSMDGIGPLAEYIRTNTVWDRWIENLKEYQKEFSNWPTQNLGIVCTLSVFNIHKYNIIKEYFKSEDINVTTNMLFGPDKLCAYNINQRAKDYLNELYKDKYPEILHFVNFENKIDPKEITEFIDRKDNNVIKHSLHKNYRAFRDVEPEWYAMLKG